MITSKSLPYLILKPYIELKSSNLLNLHSEAVMLQSNSTFDSENKLLSLIGMNMPPQYRKKILNSIITTPVSSDNNHNDYCNIFFQNIHQIKENYNHSGSISLSLKDSLLLYRLSEYEILVNLKDEIDVPHDYLKIMSSKILDLPTEKNNLIQNLKRLLDKSNDFEFISLIISFSLIQELAKKGKTKEARDIVTDIRKKLYSSCLDISGWLNEFFKLKLEFIQGLICLYSGKINETVKLWLHCINNSIQWINDNKYCISYIETWCYKEFLRRRIENLIRILLKQGNYPNYMDLAKLVIQLDPYDARAWILYGDLCMLSDTIEAANSYCFASYLDPFFSSLAAYRSSYSFYLSGLKINAIHEAKRSLDYDSNNTDSALLLKKLQGYKNNPISSWANKKKSRKTWAFHTYRPFFDLTPVKYGPSLVFGPLIAFDNWISDDDTLHIQRVLPPSFRDRLCEQAGLPDYNIWEPSNLPNKLWTKRWSLLVDGLKNFNSLNFLRRKNLSILLITLALYEPLLLYLHRYSTCPFNVSSDEAELSYIYAFSEFMLFRGNGIEQYLPQRFELISERAPIGSKAKFNSELLLLVYTSRFLKSPVLAKKWNHKAENSFDLLNFSNEFSNLMTKSRLHRAGAFVSFLEQNYDQTINELKVALKIGKKIPVNTKNEKIIKNENLHPILETLSKTYIAINELEKALKIIRWMIKIDPWDSKSHIELANILFALNKVEEAAEEYQMASTLGPPGTEISSFLAGLSYAAANQKTRSLHMYLRSLEVNPNGLSPKEKLKSYYEFEVIKNYLKN